MSSVMVSNQDIANQVRSETIDIQRSLGRIEGKLDAQAGMLAAHTKDDHYNFEAINTQLDRITPMLYKSMGVISFLAISIPAAIAYFK